MNNKALNFKLKLAFAIVYLICIISVEFTYREQLLAPSLAIEASLQANLPAIGMKFFKAITLCGEIQITIALFAMVFLFFPLNKSFPFLSALLYASYFTNVMQMLYHSPRPFWIDNKLKTTCNTAFGNPSGHSFTTFSLYCLLMQYTTDFDCFRANWKGKTLRAIICVLYVILMLCILTSRIVLGAHLINQVIYGSLLGFALYFILYHVMSYHQMTNEEFYDHLFNKSGLIIYPLVYILLIAGTCMVYSFYQIDFQYAQKLLALCPDKRPYNILYNENFFQTMAIFGLIFSHYGLLLVYWLCVRRYSKENAIFINEWNRSCSVSCFFIRLPVLMLSCGFIFLNFIPSGELWIRFVFKSAVPMALGTFGLYGVGLYICVIIGKCNYKIYNDIREINTADCILNEKDQFLL